MRPRLLAAIALTLGAAAMMPSGTAFADPAGPTDYRSEIVAIEPEVDGIDIEILGGDSFVELTVVAGVTVDVPGYRAEPYLRFEADGTVLENRNSPTTYQNEERYGTDFPEFASYDAPPDWAEVASDGTYAWHDHRAHWMQPIRPAGKQPGDLILEQVVPLVVDGQDVDVVVTSTWLPEPSRAPLLVGALLGVGGAAAGVLLRRSGRPVAAVALAVSVPAVVVGWWQYRSFPVETGPRLVWWALPAAAAILSAGALALHRRDRFWSAAGSLLAGLQLIVWGVVKRDGLSAAIAATDAPDWLDRLVVTLALVGGAGVVAAAGWTLAMMLSGTRREFATT